MSKYQKSIIYKIFDNTNGNVYYGSTYNLLRVRMNGHKTDANHDMGRASQQIILNGNYSYSRVEPYPCNSRQELHTRERYWIENFDCVNKNVPCRTNKEWRNDNKEKVKDYKTDYHIKNKEKIKKRDAEYNANNKEEISKQKAEYYIKNKEEILEKRKEYQADNKDKISKTKNTIVVCECGSKITHGVMARHLRTAKHTKLLALVCPPCPP